MPSDSLLTITGANKSYGGIPALIDAALDLRVGEVHALIGENGAGKSTLIKLLAGVLSADSIHISLQGRTVGIHQAQAAFDLGLRFIHQELNSVSTLSVAENIFLNQSYPRRAGILVNWRRLNEQAGFVLTQLGVMHIAPHHLMARLSPGDQMLVSMARAFAGDDVIGAGSGQTQALVYVMDEPTAALSRQETALLFSVINRLRERGSAILYVSHRLDEIFQIANRVTVMRDGRVVDTSAIQDVTPADLIRLMTGREVQQVYPPREMPTGERVRLDVQHLRTNGIQGVSFQLAEGEILGVAGLIGSGRTELLRGIMGADRRLGGSIVLDGQPVRGMSPTDAWQRGIAFVPEERRSQGVILSQSISRNISLPQLRHFSRSGGFLNQQAEHQAARVLGESVRLKAQSLDQTVRQLSGGNQQKVVFARALARPPQVLLLDEPTRGIDIGAKMDIYALIRQISDQGTGIVMVSSELPELLGLADRILVMRGGRLVDIVTTAGLTEESLLALCYGQVNHDSASTH